MTKLHINNHKNLQFENLTSERKIDGTINTLCYGLPDSIRSKITNISRSYLTEMVEEFQQLSDMDREIKFHDSCKQNSEQFIKIAQRIMTRLIEDPEFLIVEISKYSNFNQVSVEGEVVYKWTEFYPRRFRKIINMLKFLNYLDEPTDKLSLIHVLISLSEFYKDIRYVSAEAITMEERRIQNTVFVSEDLANQAKSRYEEFFREEFIQFIDDIMDGQLDCLNPYIKKMVNDIRISIRRVLNVRNIQNLECPNYVSMASSGMTDGDTGKTIPALFADIFEIIPEEIRDIPVFGNNFMKDPNYYIDSNHKGRSYGKFITIPQSKLKRRGIHISPNFINDRLSYYHSLASSILANIDRDCTFNQHKGYNRVNLYTTDKSFQLFSLDLTSATDTWLIENQADMLRCILKRYPGYTEDIISSWVKLMTFEEILPRTNELVSMKIGQPQGRLSSFPMFALTHHFIMIYVLWSVHGMSNTYCDYVILGDDSFIVTKDPAAVMNVNSEFIHPISQTYKTVLSYINVECNLDKGYQSYLDGEVRIAEFAKVLSMGGYVLTSAPWNLITKCNSLSYWLWWLKYSPWENIETVSYNISRELNIDRQILLKYLSLEVDYNRGLAKLGPLFDSNYDGNEMHKFLYLKDKWLIANSILLNLLNTKSKEELPIELDYEFILKSIERDNNALKKYIVYDSPKLMEVLDLEMIKAFLREALSQSIELNAEDRYIQACLNAVRLTSNEILDGLTDVLNTLEFEEQYERSIYFNKVINSLRGRSFKIEMLNDLDWFMDRYDTIVEMFGTESNNMDTNPFEVCIVDDDTEEIPLFY